MKKRTPTQMNFGPHRSYKRAEANKSVVKAPQTNFGTPASKREGGRNKSRSPVQFSGRQGVAKPKTSGAHFGERAGTGQRGGY